MPKLNIFSRNILKVPDYDINFLGKNVDSLNFNESLKEINNNNRKLNKGEGVRIGVLDSGRPDHCDLIHSIAASKNFSSSPTVNDVDGHSTSVCGIISARKANGIGITGIAPESKIYIGKVLNDNLTGNDKSLSDGIYWCIEQGCHIINLSVGAPSSADTKFKRTKEAIAEAVNRGIVLFAAAGNNATNKVDFPAKFDEVLCIVAVDKNNNIAKFSNSGPEVDFSALGEGVVTTFLEDQFASVSGTSFACPVATGIGALLIAEDMATKNKKINNWMDMRAILITISSPIGTSPWNPIYGFGNIVFGKYNNTVNPYTLNYGLTSYSVFDEKESLFKRILKFFGLNN